MSKLAVFLCAVLFASAANASYWSEALDKIHEKVVGIVDAAVNKVKEVYQSVQEKAEEVGGKLLEEAEKLGKKIQDEINKVLQKTEDEIKKLTGEAEGVDVTECTQLAANLEYTALSVVQNMSVCITDKLETGAGYIEGIIKVSEDVLANLTIIRDEAYHCGDNVDGVKSAAAAIVCANVAAAKATWVSTKVIPEMTIKITKLNFLLGTLQPSLAYCTTTNGLVTFYKEAGSIVDQTKKCINEKIEGAKEQPEIPNSGEEHEGAKEQPEIPNSGEEHEGAKEQPEIPNSGEESYEKDHQE